MDMRTWLRIDCQNNFSHTIKDNRLILSYPWGAKGGAFTKIDVYLSGINQFSGKPLDRKDYLFTFSSASTNVAKEVHLYGEFELHFDALQIDGAWIPDFFDPQKVRILNPNYKPYIQYSVRKRLSGWTEIDIISNCYRRLDGKLWFLVEGHYQRVPGMLSNRQLFSIATKSDSIQVLFVDDSGDGLSVKPELIDS